jgi:hypothetical protein
VPFLGFISGILAAGFYTIQSNIIWVLFVCISALSLLLIVFHSTRHWGVFLVQFGLIGLTITALQNQRLGDSHYTNNAPQSGCKPILASTIWVECRVRHDTFGLKENLRYE